MHVGRRRGVSLFQTRSMRRNEIELVVLGGALNARAARLRDDQRILTLRYGNRVQNQEQELDVARPAGLLGPIKLLSSDLTP